MSHPETQPRDYVESVCAGAKTAARELSVLDDARRSRALRAGAARLRDGIETILAANREDVTAGVAARMSPAMLDRLTLTPERIGAMAEGVEAVAALADPLAETIASWTTSRGLEISQVRIPLGVVAVIYESRPNVTADVAALCLKAGDACILKGGKEAIHSNTAIADLLATAFQEAGIPSHALQLIRRTDRETTAELLKRDDAIDVIVPRGGPSLVRAIAEGSRIPVIKHYEGVCNVYVDAAADLRMAEEIAYNAKVQRPGVCNAMENLVVHRRIAAPFLAALAPRLRAAGVELRADEAAREILPDAVAATEADWGTEYLDLILAVKIVDSVDDAIIFINRYGSGHSDSIVTADSAAAQRFLARVDSAVVYHNASTRFTDGFEFGFGAEVGISTNRIHARGPMGLRELTTYKYVVRGEGQVR
jgi:glutamate-5-semialdehyde dehydrogenase